MKLHDEHDGFTLIELVIAIGILSMVFAVVATAYILSLKVSDEDTKRFSDSQDGAVTSAYWIRDVQSAKILSKTVVQCGAAGSLLLSATWDDVEGATQKVEYRTNTVNGLLQVTRTACGTPASTTIIASHLSSASVICSANCSSAQILMNGSQDGTFVVKANRRLP